MKFFFTFPPKPYQQKMHPVCEVQDQRGYITVEAPNPSVAIVFLASLKICGWCNIRTKIPEDKPLGELASYTFPVGITAKAPKSEKPTCTISPLSWFSWAKYSQSCYLN